MSKKLEQLQERRKKLEEQIKREEAKAKASDRKLRNHRLILLGTLVERELKSINPEFEISSKSKDEFKEFTEALKISVSGKKQQ